MRARARLEAERVGGRTVCTTLRSDPPLTLRATPGGVHVVGSAAGPLGGDDLRLEVRVGPAAELDVRSVAAQLVQPGPTGAPSTVTVAVTVDADGSLGWRPEPTVVVAGADHRADTLVHLAAGARLTVREVLVLGRHGQPGGSILSRLHVVHDGVPVLRSDLAVGPVWAGSASAAVTAGHRVLGHVLAVGHPVPDQDLRQARATGVGMTTLASGDVLLLAVGDDTTTVGRALDAALGAVATADGADAALR